MNLDLRKKNIKCLQKIKSWLFLSFDGTVKEFLTYHLSGEVTSGTRHLTIQWCHKREFQRTTAAGCLIGPVRAFKLANADYVIRYNKRLKNNNILELIASTRSDPYLNYYIYA